MKLIGVLNQDETVPCASCSQSWNVRYLMKDLGLQRLRLEGFAYIWFDDAIMVNWCPQCEVPKMVRVKLPVEQPSIALAA